MSNSSIGSDCLSLYDMLAEDIPAGAQGGETTFTKAKETVDADREGAEALILFDSR